MREPHHGVERGPVVRDIVGEISSPMSARCSSIAWLAQDSIEDLRIGALDVVDRDVAARRNALSSATGASGWRSQKFCAA